MMRQQRINVASPGQIAQNTIFLVLLWPICRVPRAADELSA